MISLNRHEIEALVDLRQAAIASEEAYHATNLGKVNLPPVRHITFPELGADCHIKYGYHLDDPNFVIKMATIKTPEGRLLDGFIKSVKDFYK